jgi:hypothetical protein
LQFNENDREEERTREKESIGGHDTSERVREDDSPKLDAGVMEAPLLVMENCYMHMSYS